MCSLILELAYILLALNFIVIILYVVVCGDWLIDYTWCLKRLHLYSWFKKNYFQNCIPVVLLFVNSVTFNLISLSLSYSFFVRTQQYEDLLASKQDFDTIHETVKNWLDAMETRINHIQKDEVTDDTSIEELHTDIKVMFNTAKRCTCVDKMQW